MATLHWHAHPDVWLLVGVCLGGYALALRRWGPSAVEPWERVASRRQIICWTLGVLTLWVAADWPIDTMADEYLFSVHMLQHLLFSLVAPPLLIAGTPVWLMRKLLRPAPVLRAVRVLCRPLPALVAFNVVVAVTHWPALVDLLLRSAPVHFGVHVAVFGTAMLMWMPVLSPLLEVPRLTPPVRIFYLFAQSLVPTVPASFLTFASSPFYEFYARAPRLWGISAVTDQRVAGLLMKLGGGAILWTVIAVVFFRWYQLEESEGVDVLRWHSVDRDLSKTRLDR